MAEYVVNEKGEHVRVILDLKEYERLLEIEDELEDVRRYDEAISAVERGEDEVIPWEQAVKEIREGRVPGD